MDTSHSSLMEKLAHSRRLSNLLDNATVAGVGESAHFVEEFSSARIAFIRHLIDHHNFSVIALECSRLQADRLNEWLKEPDTTDLLKYSGPLTAGLYGSVLTWLKSYINGSAKTVQLIGVDIPNTLSPLDELDVLRRESIGLDPKIKKQLKKLGTLMNGVNGESAITSSIKWTEIAESDQTRAFTIVSRLQLQCRSLDPLLVERSSRKSLRRSASALATLKYTLEALSGMSALFSGTAMEGETSPRDYFISRSVKRYLRENPQSKLIMLAHNNHIQKRPVVFYGEIAGIPAGQHLASLPGYISIALTHLGDTVPEMDFPDKESPVGFSVINSPAAPIEPDNIENQCIGSNKSDFFSMIFDISPSIDRIRSQSATAEVNVAQAFDMVICSKRATKDTMVPF